MNETQNNNVPVTTQNETVNSTALKAIIELNQRYQEGTKRYAQGIQNYNLQMEKIKTLIDEAMAEKKEDEENYSKLENEVNYQTRTVAQSNDRFHKAIASLEELENEYKESMDASDYMNIVKKKKQSLQKLLDNIEEQEEVLLTQELERINMFEQLFPKRKAVEALQSQLKTLELEKKHFESSQLQQVLQLPTLSTPKEEVIDIDMVEDE